MIIIQTYECKGNYSLIQWIKHMTMGMWKIILMHSEVVFREDSLCHKIINFIALLNQDDNYIRIQY